MEKAHIRPLTDLIRKEFRKYPPGIPVWREQHADIEETPFGYTCMALKTRRYRRKEKSRYDDKSRSNREGRSI